MPLNAAYKSVSRMMAVMIDPDIESHRVIHSLSILFVVR